ncbi:MAG: hypothetical protein VX000_10815, partial [Myxococcota bacterium]|nr:hypothetical protein [Myxococcota bacterium]
RYATFLGRTDIYMKRKDTGHGLSERLEVTKLEDKAYFVREVAHKRMGIEFIDQLFLNPNACIPDLDGDILTYLAIYQKLHPKADVFIAVPHQGKVNDPYIWAYDKNAAQLKLISGGTDGFPVRFALVFSTGLLYSKGGVSVDDDFDDSLAPGRVLDANRINPELDAGTLPFDFELRGHWNRLMVNLGAEFGKNVGADGDQWVDYYQTPGNNKDESIQTIDTETDEVVLNTRNWNRHLYMGAGVVMGPDAGIGFGPRIAAQFGWMNVPHSHQATLHFGWALQPPIGNFGGRVRPLVDLDLRAGANIPYRRSLRYDFWSEKEELERQGVPEEHLRRAYPVFGGNLGVGFTF